jgi:hypothetical protein
VPTQSHQGRGMGQHAWADLVILKNRYATTCMGKLVISKNSIQQDRWAELVISNKRYATTAWAELAISKNRYGPTCMGRAGNIEEQVWPNMHGLSWSYQRIASSRRDGLTQSY